ncbi:uncharacterized protein LOC124157063 [Ischnura elegans]|uniref:uncharacterized protein LOC124157063 n=1 Tax=Ischnura elegans TaxID=197161 RepID=UPI001ED89101|nr:uncharacterized protein LOC124157063 [Ischnura elegans]
MFFLKLGIIHARNYFFIFLSFWLCTSISRSHTCEVSRSYKCFKSMEGCNPNQLEHCHTADEIRNVTMEPFNDTIIVKFLHPPFECCFKKYELKLMVVLGVDNESSCYSNAMMSPARIMHSKRDYVINKCEGTNCTGSSCGEFAEVEFGHIFTACYMLELSPFKDMRLSPLKSRRSSAMYIRTSYIKPNISEESLGLYHSYSYPEKELKISLDNHLMFRHLDITVSVEYKNSVQKHIFELCNKGTERNPLIAVETQNGTCHHNNTKRLYFTAENVPAGNYTVDVVAGDDRCTPGSLWVESSHCKWRTIINGTLSINVPVVAVTNNTIMWIAIFIAVILFHAIIIVWFVLRRQKRQILEVQNESSIPLRTMKSKLNLLLLYPRDCIPFMKTMSSFRRFLECFDDVEVHDCYSMEDNGHDPLDWLRTVMNYPQLCIIIVTTPCAFILQEAIQSGAIDNPCDVYINPSYLDSVFIYGLKQIMNDFSCDVYQRIHIMGFEGFSDDSKIISLPSSLTRYNMLEHLDALISKMNLAYNQGRSYQYSLEYISLKSSITDLKSYRRQNPEYLKEVLNLC